MGRYLARLHNGGIAHGDPTTSNFILVGGTLAVIDFGLAHKTESVEDLAVDLHLVKEVFHSAHVAVGQEAIDSFRKGYSTEMGARAEQIWERVNDIERRGRYARSKWGGGLASEIVMATANRHKVEEANLALKDFGITLIAHDIKGKEIQSLDPADVAKSCLEDLLRSFGKPLVVEDTALFVKALNGFPGALAADAFRTIGNKGILKLLGGEEDRSAYFEAAVAYGIPPDRIWVFTGRVQGSISEEPRGSEGFGFDPIFVPEGPSQDLRRNEVGGEGLDFAPRPGVQAAWVPG